MPQHTSSEVTVGFNTITYLNAKEKVRNLIKTTTKKTNNILAYTILKSAGKYINASKEKVFFRLKRILNP